MYLTTTTQYLLHSPQLLPSLALLLLAYILRLGFWTSRGTKSRKVEDSPVLGKSGDADFLGALREGYAKFKDSTFTIPTAHKEIVIIPPKFLDEIKALPEHEMTFKEQVSERFLEKYTGLGITDTLVHSVKIDLTKNIPNILNDLQDEVGYAVSKHIGDVPEWKPLPLYHMLSHLVALLSSRIFVGYPLNRNETWLRASLGYTLDGFTGSDKLWAYPRFLHPIVHHFIPELRAVHRYIADGTRLIEPIMKERRAAMQKGGASKSKKPADMIQWIIDNSDAKNGKNTKFVTRTQMLISVVAIHTTTMTMAQALFDLVSHPEYIAPLREEMKAVKASDGEKWTKAGIAKLRKMDSFMKESQRFRPPGLVTMTRKCQIDIKLSNGTVLPKGTFIGVAAQANALDPQYFDKPDEFDGFRFEKLRALPGNDNKYQFVTTNNADQLHWGVGTHACPGRFFAQYEIKMLLSEILLKYEFKLPEGMSRPPDIGRDIRIVPNPFAEVLFRNVGKGTA